MYKITFKTALALTATLIVTGHAEFAAAHCRDNLQLGSSRGAVDLYRVRCANGDGSEEAPSLLATNKLFARIDHQQATVAGQSVSVQIGREGTAPNASVLVTDATGVVGGTTGGGINEWECPAVNASGQTALIRGNGNYNILASKTGTATMNYGLVWHCQDINGMETVTTEVVAGGAAPELAGNSGLTSEIDLLIDR